MEVRKAIIVGAGGAGLAALRSLHQCGFAVMAFEKDDALGGVWATTRYPGLTIHSQSFNYRFHDFPAVASRGPSATREEIRQYFTDFAHAKQLADKIRYRHRVTRVVHRPARAVRKCLVTAIDVRTGQASEHEADVVVLATGFSNAGRPHMPVLAGRDASAVEVLHSSMLAPELVDDIVANQRRLVVLGAGKSAHEILCLFRDTSASERVTWVYEKALWSLSYEKLYARSVIPWNVLWYLYYLAIAAARRHLGFGTLMKLLQAPLRWSGLLVNPLEPASDVCTNRSAIMKADQLVFLRSLRSVKAQVSGLGVRDVQLANGERIAADVLVCATGYDRRLDLPAIEIAAGDSSCTPYDLTARHAFYQQMIDPEIPEISILAANVLYPQQLLGYSLGAEWLARFHAGRLVHQPTGSEMERAIAADTKRFSPWASGAYRSGGQPYAHERNENVLPQLFAQMGIAPSLARKLVRSGANPTKFAALCDQIAAQLGRGT